MSECVSVLVKNSCSTVGEGPHWEEKTQTLLYVDIDIGEIHKYNTLTGEDTKIKLDDRVGYVVPRASGGYAVGLGRQMASVDWDTKDVTLLAEVDIGKETRLNDGKCDASGRLWAGTMGLEKAAGVLEHKQGSLYSLDPDGTLRMQHSPVTISNGLAWSADNKTMFYIDTTPRQVVAFDYDIQAGNIDNRRVVADFTDKPHEFGYPDGMCIDADGKLWVAMFFGGGIVQVDPETGTVIRKVDIPAARTTSCCFGGPNYDEMFVTCSDWAVPEDERAKNPLAGSVFKVTELGVKGLPAPDYRG